MLDWATDGSAAYQGMDFIATGFGGLFIGLAIAGKLELPLLQAHYAPLTPTGAFAGVLAAPGVSQLGKAANRLSHHVTRQMIWQQTRQPDMAARQQVLGLPPAPFFGPYRSPRQCNSPILYGFSPAVIAKPDDWGDDIHVTGYWFLEAETSWTPPPALEQFLQSGPAPLHIGLGSMSSRKPEETAHLILQAVAQTGQRAILFSGWNGLKAEKLPENVLVIDSAPHAWLFERVAAVVHHGSAGTTAAGLRGGRAVGHHPLFR